MCLVKIQNAGSQALKDSKTIAARTVEHVGSHHVKKTLTSTRDACDCGSGNFSANCTPGVTLNMIRLITPEGACAFCMQAPFCVERKDDLWI